MDKEHLLSQFTATGWSNYFKQALQSKTGLAEWILANRDEPVSMYTIEKLFLELHTPDADENNQLINTDLSLSIVQARSLLRKLRCYIFCLIMERDLNRIATLTEVTHAMSQLADFCLALAYRSVCTNLQPRYGIPRDPQTGLPQETLFIAMGKLGGNELNVSSDIDLVILYGAEGETDGPVKISSHEWHRRITQGVMPILAELDGDGYVFRTDLRLRPNGDSGPVAWSLDAFEQYLKTQGREWERYAWLKARPILAQAFPNSMPEHDLQRFEQLRQPFVYRPYLDYDAIAALRDLRNRINLDWGDRYHKTLLRPSLNRSNGSDSLLEPIDNIKLGTGGIREIEFIVQLYQLMRGGCMPELQISPLLEALSKEQHLGLINDEDAHDLKSAYYFLRRLEHVLQYKEDAQTHLLSKNNAIRTEVSRLLGFPTRDAFESCLSTHRQKVNSLFKNAFHRLESHQTTVQPGVSAQQLTDDAHPIKNNKSDHLLQAKIKPSLNELASIGTALIPHKLLHLLEPFGKNARHCEKHIYDFLTSTLIARLPRSSRLRLSNLIPHTIEAALHNKKPELALIKLLNLFERIAQRSTYLALLTEHPEVLERVAYLMSASEWAAQYLMQHPLLLDEFVDSERMFIPLDIEKLKTQLNNHLQACLLRSNPDIERQMNVLRDVHHQQVFHLLAQDLAAKVSVEQLGDYLSQLADVLLTAALKCCWQAFQGQLSKPKTPLSSEQNPLSSKEPHFAIIAYGKLGGKELGYSSDLDLVFLYDDDSEEAAEIYARLAQRLMTWLSAMTSSGRLYEIDLRLRPDGEAGLLVSTIDAFEHYQEKSAWIWEHQALSRARYCAGDASIGKRFEKIRRKILLKEKPLSELKTAILEMRQRIHEGHPNHSSLFDIKHGPGGMVDVEFIVQYLVLAYAHQHPVLLENLGNIALLQHAGKVGLIDQQKAMVVADAYRELRRRQHELRLQDKVDLLVPPDECKVARQAVMDLWESVFKSPI